MSPENSENVSKKTGGGIEAADAYSKDLNEYLADSQKLLCGLLVELSCENGFEFKAAEPASCADDPPGMLNAGKESGDKNIEKAEDGVSRKKI